MDKAPIKHLFIITGTTRGLGRALAQEVLKHPDSYLLSLSRTPATPTSNSQEMFLDLGQSESIGPVFDAVQIDFGGLETLENTVLINNAGVLDPMAPLVDCDDAALAASLRINLLAPMLLARAFYHFSRGFAGQKMVLNITSGASRNAYAGWSAYCTAKAGLDMATRTLALDWARNAPGFQACAVAPGTVDTDMQAQIRSTPPDRFEKVDKFIALQQRGGLAAPEKTAQDLIGRLLNGEFENGGRYDLREMAPNDP